MPPAARETRPAPGTPPVPTLSGLGALSRRDHAPPGAHHQQHDTRPPDPTGVWAVSEERSRGGHSEQHRQGRATMLDPNINTARQHARIVYKICLSRSAPAAGAESTLLLPPSSYPCKTHFPHFHPHLRDVLECLGERRRRLNGCALAAADAVQGVKQPHPSRQSAHPVGQGGLSNPKVRTVRLN